MNFSGKQAVEKWNDILKEVSFLNTVVHPHIVDYKACFLKDTTCWVRLFKNKNSFSIMLNISKRLS